MELDDAVVIQLPAQLTRESVGHFASGIEAALASSAPVVMLMGADDTTFCTGLALDSTGGVIDTTPFASLLATLADAPKPTLAFVNGRAIGGGLGLAAACDWVVASERATFALPELLWGIIPAMIWPLVSARLGENTARQWTLTAHARSAAEAHAAGLVDELASAGQEGRGVTRAARMLRRAEPQALQQLRRWSRSVRAESLATALTRGAALTAEMAAAPAATARVSAFRDGEAPWA